MSADVKSVAKDYNGRWDGGCSAVGNLNRLCSGDVTIGSLAQFSSRSEKHWSWVVAESASGSGEAYSAVH